MGTEKHHYGLIVVSAPSGAGKSTLCTKLLSKHVDRIALSISATSRAPRGTEQYGQEYFFTSPETFKEEVRSNAFAEWALVHGNYYGTRKATLQKFWSARKHVLLDIDVQGAESLRRAYPDNCFSLFIAPPSMKVLEERLRGRGTDTEETIQKRMKNAILEMNEQNKFDLILTNDDFELTFQEFERAIFKFMDSLEEGTWQKRP